MQYPLLKDPWTASRLSLLCLPCPTTMSSSHATPPRGPPIERLLSGPRVSAHPYAWPHNGSLSPETTALVIIDMQKDCNGLQSPPSFHS